MLRIGIDIGSTTVKIVVLDEQANIIYKCYSRHMSQVRQKTVELLSEAKSVIGGNQFTATVTGSAGLGMAKAAQLEFAQEVFVTGEMVKVFYPQTDCVIELGGEDVKIIFFTGGLEERMNGSCAGGTGAFIDQMASLLNTTPTELDELSLRSEKIYSIASRCGVFAKTDIQPLLNQGARKEDIAASIYQAVVDQTITGLAQGREVKGNVLFLGGPLFFFKGLRNRFVETLGLDEQSAIFPEIAPYAVALGAALYSGKTTKTYGYDNLVEALTGSVSQITGVSHLPPFFENEEDYGRFYDRHIKATLKQQWIDDYSGDAYLGIDCGSTTTKLVLISDNNDILFDHYCSNKGNPVSVVKEQLEIIYGLCGDGRIKIKSVAVTGYGEDLIKNAFNLDYGLVETQAHFKAAKYFSPSVDFIIDIGGQDIKCFKIKNGAIDNIILNEACSSGCGSFIETFAHSMGYDIESFCKMGLFAKSPIELGSRCTVFMNSSVKQAQKDGATVADISAGLSASIVKNALYKVIRIHSADELGANVVVQGGTFLNDAILRCFEKEIGRDVVRPAISGLMGAFGAALHAKEKKGTSGVSTSSLISREDLSDFTHTSKATHCKMCTNNCSLTVNTFPGGRRFISGNKCERPLGIKINEALPNMYAYKLDKLSQIAYTRDESVQRKNGKNGKIGIPFGLNMFEMLPFFKTLMESLDFEVVVSDISTRKLYRTGQSSIPSDTVCYPAKLMHGHIENLITKGITKIFYPCMTYNIDEGRGVNHYNCPVVAYYPELLKANMSKLSDTSDVSLMMPYFEVSNRKLFTKQAAEFIRGNFPHIKRNEVVNAVKKAYAAFDEYLEDIKSEGLRAVEYAEKHGETLLILAGRPYHIDPEINHGMDKLLNSFGLVIVTEEIADSLVQIPQEVNVLNQWTYHSRLYNSAKYAVEHPNAQLIQLVSFGCGIDAVTTDEVREIMERGGKLYTQIKIDEINNLGAARIRIRSMLEAVK